MAAKANVEDKLVIEVEVEVKCSGDKFYASFQRDMKEVPGYLPHIFKSFELLEGDGGVGTVQVWKYIFGGKSLYLKESVAALDVEKKMITHSFIEGEIMQDYKYMEKTLTVTPKGDDGSLGSLVKWTIRYVKAYEDAPAPTAFKDFMVMVTNDLNAYLLQNNQA